MIFKLRFVTKKQLAPETFTFIFKRDDEFNYSAGQYTRIILPHKNIDDWGSSRFFTISSSPSEEHMTITTTLGRSSFKNALFDLKKGETLQVFGPMGTMTLSKDATKPHIFIAGGMGVTPFRSIIKFAVDKGLQIPITLIVSWKSQEQMVFHKELSDIALKYDWFTYIPTISGLVDTKSWQGKTGRISEKMIQDSGFKIQDSRFYITGVQEMVDNMRDMVQSLGVDEENIKTEVFTIIE